MNDDDIQKLIAAMKPVFATKEDLDVFPTAEMIQREFEAVGKRLDKIE